MIDPIRTWEARVRFHDDRRGEVITKPIFGPGRIYPSQNAVEEAAHKARNYLMNWRDTQDQEVLAINLHDGLGWVEVEPVPPGNPSLYHYRRTEGRADA